MKELGIFTLIALLIALFIVGPVFTIMALNTLFGLGIELSFGSWFATFWLTLLFASPKAWNKN